MGWWGLRGVAEGQGLVGTRCEVTEMSGYGRVLVPVTVTEVTPCRPWNT